MPICAKIAGEKYWIADTPVIWVEAWQAQARRIRRVFALVLKSSLYERAACSCSSWIWLMMISYSATT